MFPNSLDVQPEKLLIPEYVENDGEKIELGQKLYTAKIDQYGTIYGPKAAGRENFPDSSVHNSHQGSYTCS